MLPAKLILSVKLFDLTGQLLFSESNSPFIQVNHLHEGIYLFISKPQILFPYFELSFFLNKYLKPIKFTLR